ncbi:sigma 54-interacting transcriptional regulator [Azomonas macrocytogenes]|uniref:DNA-binding NtrC family response regulator n=1 Tax=Azomonas macrocytogenes TaxID=69962 RepID=A0A839T393_AZOMA|nr:sigma 54-interacting transcriptional regulator [Azomonas macrocytogenes]MBB3102203.1 DNA-binding NtrC family response regulator [Azomonas macrocytogenes]
MPFTHKGTPALLAFADSERSPLSIRARALVFVDPRSCQVRERLDELAAGPLPVLIQGESGTGKELLARQIHQGSVRSGLFVAVSCSAISQAYGEAELFGYVAGAHSSLSSSRAGWFGSAHGGTLYLEEVADLSLALQARLLTALETGQVMRVGGQRPLPVDVRLVAATSFDLSLAVKAGKFNRRLFDYLDRGHLSLPPLRERPADIMPLAQYFLELYCTRLELPLPQIGAATRAVLESHNWPGNTRELENCIHFALLVCENDEILPNHLYLPR